MTVWSGATNGAVTSNSSEDSNIDVSVNAGTFRLPLSDESTSAEVKAAEAGLEILTATITQRTEQFFTSETNGDPDQPSEGFSSVAEAVEAVRSGQASYLLTPHYIGERKLTEESGVHPSSWYIQLILLSQNTVTTKEERCFQFQTMPELFSLKDELDSCKIIDNLVCHYI